ncbi:MAG TPA: ABC transporter permease [Candidatus Acidoferrales bacterium]|nr:ABC transporter permease [Candidatus Acidoferrales bacterium]
MWQGLANDVRYALRRIANSPGFTLLVVLILALGIGANSAMFSVVDAALLRPLPFRSPERLLQVYETESAAGHFPLTGQDYLDWRAQNRTFDDMAVYSYQKVLNASGIGTPERATVVETQANFFSVLGVRPMAGRAFVEGEDQAGKNRVAILSYGYWQSHFGGQADAIGKSLELDGAAYQIVGVMPSWYLIPGTADAWIPIDMSAKSLGGRGEHHLRVVGRLKAGVSAGQAEADLKGIAANLEKQFPESNGKVGAAVVPLKEALVGRTAESLYILLGAVALVLLIACANVANLLLARATARRREVAVRLAMGAGRPRLLRQLLTESVLLSVLGGLLGIALAYGCLRVLTSGEWFPVRPANPIEINAGVLLLTLVVSLVVGIVFGMAPAFQASRISLNDDLKSGGTKTATAPGGMRLMREALVAAEIALSLTLLTGAGLLLRTFANLRQADTGAHAENVLTANVILPPGKYDALDSRWAFYERLVQSLRESRGVRAAALSTELPLEGGSNGYITVDGQTAESTQNTLVEWNYITPDYFRTMGIPLKQGRAFSGADLASTKQVAEKATSYWGSNIPVDQRPKFEFAAIVNESMARRFWPNQAAIGQVFHEENISFRVIGVVGNVKVWSLRQEPMPQAYFPLTLALAGPDNWPINVAVESAGRPEDAASVVRSQVHLQDSTLAVARLRTMNQIVAESLTDTSYQTALLGTFAGLALLLATMGIYGVMAYVVSQRTNEFGIRMALGAGPARVLGMVVGQGARLAAAGAIAGLAAAVALAGVLRKLLYGVEPADPATLAMVFVLTIGICVAACAIPARRAARVDPLVALRYE